MSNLEFPKYDTGSEYWCPVNYCKEVINVAIENSNAHCVFAREGTLQVKKIIGDIQRNNALSDDYALLKDLLNTMYKNTNCEVVKEASNICSNILVKYEGDWDKHIKRGICKNLVCIDLCGIYIDPEVCTGCTECKKIDSSILGSEGFIHIIQSEDCDKDLLVNICPERAIKKYGQSKPKIPIEPIEVGTFTQEDNSGRRRKKKRL